MQTARVWGPQDQVIRHINVVSSTHRILDTRFKSGCKDILASKVRERKKRFYGSIENTVYGVAIL